jgi:hypothetical protein
MTISNHGACNSQKEQLRGSLSAGSIDGENAMTPV